MLVYNIRRSKYSKALSASGFPNRWNKQDEFVIYAGQSISLAVLEMVAHRSSIMVNSGYKLLTIEVKIDEKEITYISAESLPKRWKSLEFFHQLQNKGSEWYQSQKSLVLCIPSVLVPSEFNYVIHTNHPDFTSKVRIVSSDDFTWEKRLL